MTTSAPAPPDRTRELAVWIPPLLDLVAVTAFVLIGRRSHDEGETFTAFLKTWWPFAAGLGLSGALTGAWWHPFAWSRVALMWVGTVVVGMILRISINGRELKPSFVIVTTVFLGLCFFGWRLVARAVVRRRAAAA